MTEKECRQGKWVNYIEAKEFLFKARNLLKQYNISLSDTLNSLEEFSKKWDWTISNIFISLNNKNKIELYTGIVYGDKYIIL